MRIAILGDLHLVSPHDPDTQRREQRRHFALAWPSFKAMARAVRAHAPDLVIALGDLVDWYSRENRDFAIACMDELRTPWLLTPGNHDLNARAGEPHARAGWSEAGIALGNRALDADGIQAILLDSATSRVPPGTGPWLNDVLASPPGRPTLFTHVPVNTRALIDYVVSVDPHKNLSKYVQQEPLFDTHLRGRVNAIFSAHLHFAGHLTVEGTRLHLRPLSVTAHEKHYPGQGQVAFLETTTGETLSITPASPANVELVPL